MSLNQLSKHFCGSNWGISKTCILKASTASSNVEKRWPLILFFTYGNKKKSFGAKSGLYSGVFKNAVVWELTLSWWRVIRLRRLVFLISWKTTGKQTIVYHSELTVLRYSNGTIGHVQFFSGLYDGWLIKSMFWSFIAKNLQIKRLAVCSSIFYYSKKMDQTICIKFCALNPPIGMIGIWFQCYSHTHMIRHQLWPFVANLDRRWTLSTSPERCPCWLWRLASLLWAEHKLSCGITGLSKTKNMSMTMLGQPGRWKHWSSKENDFR